MATVENFILRFKTEGANNLKNLADDIAALGQGANPLGNTLGGLTGRLGPLGTAASAAAAAFVALGIKSVNLADELDDLSASTGIAAGELFSLKEQMISAGGNSESYAKSVTRLSVAIGEAMTGNESYQKSFQKLGVFVTDANGKMRDSSDIMNDVIKKLAGIDDPATRAAMAVALMGKEAARIDWTKIQPKKDPEMDQYIQALAEMKTHYEEMMAMFEKGLIKWFGELAKSFNQAGMGGGLAYLTEQIGIFVGEMLNIPTDAIAGVWNALVPEWLGIKKAVGLGDPLIELVKKAKKAREEAMAVNKPPAQPGKPNTGGGAGGGFGATPEATLKAQADSRLRIEQARLEAQKLQEQMYASDIAKIEIARKYDIEKAKADIFAKERLSEVEKTREFEAKKLEIETKAALDIANVRKDIAKSMRDQQFQLETNTSELQKQFDLVKNTSGLGPDAIALQSKLNDLEIKRTQEKQKAAENSKGEIDVFLQQLEVIDQQIDAQRKLIEQQAEYQRSFEYGWSNAYAAFIENGTNAAKIAGDSFNSLTNNMMSALDKFVETGKFNFGDFARSVIMDLMKIQLRAAAVQLFQASGIGSIFGLPGKAIGGPVIPNQPYLIGERGPEIFLPSSAGNIVPNNQLSGLGSTGGNTYITNNISAIDAKSVAQLFAENRMSLLGTVEQARRELPMRTR